VIADSKREEHKWGEIEEINEDNNVYSKEIGPDLSVGEIYTEPTEPAGNCNCYVVAEIKNEGNLCATNFKVRLIVNSTSGNETRDETETIGSLGPHETINLTFKSTALEPNRIYDVKVIADPDSVKELNEGNNISEIDLTLSYYK